MTKASILAKWTLSTSKETDLAFTYTSKEIFTSGHGVKIL